MEIWLKNLQNIINKNYLLLIMKLMIHGYWSIGGKVDGIAFEEDNSKRILEIKNRVNKLFNVVRDYEKVQCYAYMYALDIPKYILLKFLNQEKIIK